MALYTPASAAPPAGVPGGAIAVEVANGFETVGEQHRPDGTVLSTFASPTETVRTIAWDEGATISFFPGKATAATDRAAAHGSLLVASGTERPKDPADVNRLHDSGRTVVGDLVALGMPRADAERIFGDMETMDGSNPYTGAPGAAESTQRNVMTLASSTTRDSESERSAVPSSSTTP